MALPTSHLSGENVLRDIHDPVTQTIRTSATAIVAPGLEVDISHTNDSIRLGDGTSLITSTNILGKQALDVNVANNIAVTIPPGSAFQVTDGFDILLINPDGSLNFQAASLPLPTGAATEVTLAAVAASLSSIDTKLPVNLDAFSATPDSVQLVGSVDGTSTGTKFGVVNNIRQQILSAHDREEAYTYADFGTKNERVTRIDYTSVTFPGFTIRRDFSYTIIGTNYRLDDISWTVV